ncbi:hypothetical protein LEP1GSC195_1385 [Leptospira wolbachii serovar Codice str. CDC]|uniref:Uncharacterized protein n=1 Tax=Leptospira wolbachii serovar Codice str. CDC TaxID=1218599 RepID=R8ZXV9_9LEPT|nr:hypothetical protein LEP1GSC195_1385 [Leptospira wolbachii serovar Codice str. CDC]
MTKKNLLTFFLSTNVMTTFSFTILSTDSFASLSSACL